MQIFVLNKKTVLSLQIAFKHCQQQTLSMGNSCSGKPRAIINSQYYIEALNDPKETKSYNQGRVYEYKGLYEEAITEYNRAIKFNPNSSMSYNGIANCMLKKNDVNGAINTYRKAIEINPNNKFAYNGLGTCYDNLNDRHNAINHFNKAIEIDKDFSYPYNGLGNLHYFNHDYSQALPYYETAVKLSPQNPVMHANLACNYAMLGRMDEAFQYFESAKAHDKKNETELSPGNRYYLATKLTEFERAVAASDGDHYKARLRQVVSHSRTEQRISSQQRI